MCNICFLIYRQHYGLLRDPKKKDEIQSHSWSDYGLLTNWLILDLGLHHEHHNSSMPNSKNYVAKSTPIPAIFLVPLSLWPSMYFHVIHKAL